MNKLLLGLILSVATLPGQAVIIDDKDWWQPVDFTGGSNSFNDIADVCDTLTGACNGSIMGNDITGWSWATNVEVGDLFDDLDVNSQTNNNWAGDIIHITADPDDDTGLFDDTFSDNIAGEWYGFLYGIARSEASDPNIPYIAGIQDDPIAGQDFAEINAYAGFGDISFGIWLYKAVPEPATFALFGVGLAGLGLVRRRNKPKH